MELDKFLLDYEWTLLAPELTILVTATIMSLIDLFMKDETNRRPLSVLGMVGLVVASVFVITIFGREPYQILGETYRVDTFGSVFKLLLLAGSFLILIMAPSQLKDGGVPYKGEFYYLLLIATLGGMIMTSSADLITLFIGLEPLSIASYILVGARKHVLRSNEAAFKYFVLGGVSTAFTLYGMSFMYGLTGSTNLYDIRSGMLEAYQSGYGFFVLVSLAFVLLGVGFKLAAAPFHMWAPDVYTGAITPVTSYLSVVSKTAAFALVVRLFVVGYGGMFDTEASDRMLLIVAILAALSMIIGNTVALRQRNVKRLMAYSSIAHAGYLLVLLATLGIGMFEALVFYLLAYLFTVIGAFAVIMFVNREAGTEDIKSFAGLFKRAPWTATAMTVFVLSLAGIPLTGGFFGKFYIFFNAIAVKGYTLAGLMVATTVISYFYYFEIIRQMFFRPPVNETRPALPVGLSTVIIIGVIGTVVLGVAPQLVLDTLNQFPLTDMLSPGANS